MAETQKATHVALLAPVPLVHLESALATVASKGRAAFGTTKWELINKLEGLRKNMGVDVYIYASHGDGYHDPETQWRGTYVGYAKDKWEAAPYRPESAASDSVNGEIYWLVQDLRKAPETAMPIAEFTPFGGKEAYGHAFTPHGPLLVEHPL